MHELRLIHTDLKPENILLVSPEDIKVPDYKVYFVLLLNWSIHDLPFAVPSYLGVLAIEGWQKYIVLIAFLGNC